MRTREINSAARSTLWRDERERGGEEMAHGALVILAASLLCLAVGDAAAAASGNPVPILAWSNRYNSLLINRRRAFIRHHYNALLGHRI